MVLYRQGTPALKDPSAQAIASFPNQSKNFNLGALNRPRCRKLGGEVFRGLSHNFEQTICIRFSYFSCFPPCLRYFASTADSPNSARKPRYGANRGHSDALHTGRDRSNDSRHLPPLYSPNPHQMRKPKYQRSKDRLEWTDVVWDSTVQRDGNVGEICPACWRILNPDESRSGDKSSGLYAIHRTTETMELRNNYSSPVVC